MFVISYFYLPYFIYFNLFTTGAIDDSYIKIDKPLQDKDSYVNRKQFFSIILQGVVDHNKKFLDVCIGYPGSVHDARVFRESLVFDRLNILCGGMYKDYYISICEFHIILTFYIHYNNRYFSEGGYLLRDSAYPCLSNLIVPYRDNGHLTRAQTNFNIRLSSCRVVENAFGCLKQKFRQLYHIKLRNIIRLVQVIHACCILHNLANAVTTYVYLNHVLMMNTLT